MDEADRRSALVTLQKVYEDLASRAVETVLENAEGLRQGPYSFAYQELEDRFAPRLINLGHMIGALQHMGRRPQPQHEFRVERVMGPLVELDARINEVLRRAPQDTLHQVALAPAEDDEGPANWHAFLTLSRPA
jgi:hypothetical protein